MWKLAAAARDRVVGICSPPPPLLIYRYNGSFIDLFARINAWQIFSYFSQHFNLLCLSWRFLERGENFQFAYFMSRKLKILVNC
jgi:hypothetical protein